MPGTGEAIKVWRLRWVGRQRGGQCGVSIQDDDGEAGERRRGIQSVEIGFKVLDAIAAAPGPVSLSVLAQRTGLSPSQTHRYLHSLTATGLAIQDGRSGHYDLGPASRRIGIAALGRFDGFARADQVIPELVTEIRWTVLLAVLGAAGPTLVRWFMGRPPVITNLGIGSVLPLYHSATGRAFIAFGDQAELAELLHAERGMALSPQFAGMDGRTLDVATIRQEGRRNMFVRMEGRFIPGLRAISAPIFDMQGRLACCVTAIANAAFADGDDSHVATALKATCRRLTEESGGIWPG